MQPGKYRTYVNRVGIDPPPQIPNHQNPKKGFRPPCKISQALMLVWGVNFFFFWIKKMVRDTSSTQNVRMVCTLYHVPS